ncbi:hypothetical protein Syun_000912 [Stephania yunnanensis]|uniref:Uncharacterized protein n=1 Tax=Stephania yunnanensis TaxID=152371 RepID=A0AAP0Q5S5_9MAGN
MTGFGEREEATARKLARESWGCRPAVENEERELTERWSKEQGVRAAEQGGERTCGREASSFAKQGRSRQGSTEEWQLIREERSCGRGARSSGGGAPDISAEEKEEVR